MKKKLFLLLAVYLLLLFSAGCRKNNDTTEETTVSVTAEHEPYLPAVTISETEPAFAFTPEQNVEDGVQETNNAEKYTAPSSKMESSESITVVIPTTEAFKPMENNSSATQATVTVDDLGPEELPPV